MRKICGILIFSQMVLLLNGGVFDNIHSGCSVSSFEKITHKRLYCNFHWLATCETANLTYLFGSQGASAFL